MKIEPTISYTKRKSIAIKILPQGEVCIVAPHFTPRFVINQFVESKKNWIIRHQQRIEAQNENSISLSLDERQIAYSKKRAIQLFEVLVSSFSKQMELFPTTVRASSAKTRWGSCTFDNKISLNWRLILVPQELLEYVIIHELAHIRQKNHSAEFWKLVGKFCPDYKSKRKQLHAYQALLHKL
jgi:predicted metal-dependent hydrolase